LIAGEITTLGADGWQNYLKKLLDDEGNIVIIDEIS
jgi:hypothetical protein